MENTFEKIGVIVDKELQQAEEDYRPLWKVFKDNHDIDWVYIAEAGNTHDRNKFCVEGSLSSILDVIETSTYINWYSHVLYTWDQVVNGQRCRTILLYPFRKRSDQFLPVDEVRDWLHSHILDKTYVTISNFEFDPSAESMIFPFRCFHLRMGNRYHSTMGIFTGDGVLQNEIEPHIIYICNNNVIAYSDDSQTCVITIKVCE